MKYFAYVRKSTEGEERQALSIVSQINKAKEIFGDLNIVEVLEEKHSAFKPYNRPVFTSMIARIQNSEADGIIAWHPDRLSRNEIDASTITYLVRTGVIKDLKFGSYNFDNSPEGIMMLQLSLSQSQYFSSKLGKDVKRGMENKFNMGWQPNMSPNGYINVSTGKYGYGTIKPDQKRFKLLRKAFDLMLTGDHSVPEILDKLTNEWGFRSKIGSGNLATSALYKIFNNLFYAGIIKYNDKQKIGKHRAMISLEEYDRIQLLLDRKGKPRSKKKRFAFTGLIKCAECGCSVSADLKKKFIKCKKQYKEYTYYRCTHKKPSQPCKQPAIEVKKLDKQIEDNLAKYELKKEFKELAFSVIDEMKKSEPDENIMVVKNLQSSIDKLEIEKSNLTKVVAKGLIPDDEFTKQRNDYEKEIVKLKEKLVKTKKASYSNDEVKKKLEFVSTAKVKFKKGDKKIKRSILSELGSNSTLKDRKLHILAHKWLLPFGNELKELEAKYTTLEPIKNGLDKRKNPAYAELILQLQPVGESNPCLQNENLMS